jgi:hypothetical protein
MNTNPAWFDYPKAVFHLMRTQIGNGFPARLLKDSERNLDGDSYDYYPGRFFQWKPERVGKIEIKFDLAHRVSR